MFAAAEHAAGAQRTVELLRIGDHLGHIAPVAATAQGIVRLVIEGNVEHGAKIEIETEEAQDLRRDFAVAANERNIAFIAELLRVGRLFADQPQARDASAFLIDGDDRLDLRDITQIVDQLPQLFGLLDVASEKDKPARLHAAEHGSGVRIQFRPRHTDQKQLTDIVRHARSETRSLCHCREEESIVASPSPATAFMANDRRRGRRRYISENFRRGLVASHPPIAARKTAP